MSLEQRARIILDACAVTLRIISRASLGLGDTERLPRVLKEESFKRSFNDRGNE